MDGCISVTETTKGIQFSELTMPHEILISTIYLKSISVLDY